MDRILGSLGADTWEQCNRGGPRYFAKMTRVVRSTRWVSKEVPLLAQKLHACIRIKLFLSLLWECKPAELGPRFILSPFELGFQKYNPLEETDLSSNQLNANENSCKWDWLNRVQID